MIEKINNTKQIRDSLHKEGKVTVLNSSEHVVAITALNKEMEQVRREYKVKNQNSQNTAALTILTS
jgi:hypothetical protein